MKNFDYWNKKKKELEEKGKSHLRIKERQIWWLSLGLNIGDEEDGKNEEYERPVLIFKKFNNKIAWVLPMSRQSGHPKYYTKIKHQGKISFLILSQLRIVSVKRLNRIFGGVSRKEFSKIKQKIIDIIVK